VTRESALAPGRHLSMIVLSHRLRAISWEIRCGSNPRQPAGVRAKAISGTHRSCSPSTVRGAAQGAEGFDSSARWSARAARVEIPASQKIFKSVMPAQRTAHRPERPLKAGASTPTSVRCRFPVGTIGLPGTTYRFRASHVRLSRRVDHDPTTRSRSRSPPRRSGRSTKHGVWSTRAIASQNFPRIRQQARRITTRRTERSSGSLAACSRRSRLHQ